jgi:hypothetical protein
MRSSRQRRPPFDTVAIAATSTVRWAWPMLCARTSAGCRRRRRGVHVDAVIFGDMSRFTDATLNAAFRMLIDGADLVALRTPGVVVGKPARPFFAAALAD